MVLGLNDALVELTGTLAGLTLAAAEYQADRVIGADHRGFGNFVDGFV